jgi:hypothetical protein
LGQSDKTHMKYENPVFRMDVVLKILAQTS